MNIWRKWRLFVDREATEKDILMELLAPYHRWIDHPTEEENIQAAISLKRILHTIQGLSFETTRISAPEVDRHQLDYLIPLMATEAELKRGNFWGACHELGDLVYFYQVSRPGIRQNLIGLLKEYVEE